MGFMVLRVRPTPTRFPANILNTPWKACDARGAHRLSFQLLVRQITESIMLWGNKDTAPVPKGGNVLLYTHLVTRRLRLLCTIMGYDGMAESDV